MKVSLNKQLDRFEKMMKNFMTQCNRGKIIEERRSLKYYQPSSLSQELQLLEATKNYELLWSLV